MYGKRNSYLGRNQTIFRKYEQALSPFGQKVMSLLIHLEQEKENKNNVFLNYHPRPCNQSKKIIKFNDSNVLNPITTFVSSPNLVTEPNRDSRQSLNCNNISSNESVNVSSSIDLLQTIDDSIKSPFTETKTSDPTAGTSENINNVVEINIDSSKDKETISWNDLLDSELLADFDTSISTIKTTNKPNENICFDTEVVDIISKNAVNNGYSSRKDNLKRVNHKKLLSHENGIEKPKNYKKIHDIYPKNIKSIVKKAQKDNSRNIYRKEKYTTAVKNWLNDVGAIRNILELEKEPCGETEDHNNIQSDTSKTILEDNLKIQVSTENKNINREDVKRPLQKTKKNKKIVEAEVGVTGKFKNEMVPKKNKKIIQAQLANKDGVMKFAKPKDENKNNGENQVEPNDKCINEIENSNKAASGKITKEKKVKAKFVAPIKSQLPVKDITYEVVTISDTNFIECKNAIESIKSNEVFLVLIYRNGFCQLNSQHTDDTCVAEALMIHFSCTFFYMKEFLPGFNYTLQYLLTNNTIVCYDGKAIVNYLANKFDLSFYGINFVDVKHRDVFSILGTKLEWLYAGITLFPYPFQRKHSRASRLKYYRVGGHLISPDEPPESFSQLQQLVSSITSFTIASDCALQKTAWCLSSLSACAAKLRTTLVDEDIWRCFVEIEMKILPIVADMERRGICVDVDKIKSMESILLGRMREAEAASHRAAGRAFQLTSSLQVRTLLYDELQLDTRSNVRIRETLCQGAKSTSEAMLRSLVTDHPLPKLILQYRHLHKAHATFLAGIAQHVREGVVRPTWDQTAAATGRIACNNPNLQAIPKTPFNIYLYPSKENEDESATLQFRSVYVARSGYTLLAADFRHVECRVFAHAAHDARLLRALAAPDLFRDLAATWLNKPEAAVSEAERERTKRIVYASLYGAGGRRLAELLDLPYDRVLAALSSFNRTFPSLESFASSVVRACGAGGGRLATRSGRARRLPLVASADAARRAHAERQALNFLIQGTAADLCKMAMIESWSQLAQMTPPVDGHLLLQIHDELLWEVRHEDLHRAAGIIKRAMEGCAQACGIELQLPVALSAGHSWGDMEPFALDDDAV